MLLAVPFSAIAQNLSVFNGPRDYPVGGSPQSVVVADFNGDGLGDIATANWATNNVSILLQNHDGTFQPAVNYSVGNEPLSLQVGDVNNDGKLDLVVLNLTAGTIGVLLGNGDGTFQAQKVTGVSEPPGNYLVIADFNGDGKLDCAVAVSTPQVNTFALAIMLGNGDGTFQTAVNYVVNAPPYALVTADFNKDGKPDLAIANINGVSVFLGNGDGTFQTPINTALFQELGGLVVADFNQDGYPDLATESAPNSVANPGVTLLLGNGDGTFQLSYLNFDSLIPLAAGDLTGNGKPDLVVQGPGSSVTILFNGGNLTFTSGSTLYFGGSITLSGLTLSDLNGDKNLDLVAAVVGTELNAPTLPDIVSVLHGNGDGSFAVFPSYSSSGAGAPVVGDFNGDGKPDVILPTLTGTVRQPSLQAAVLLNTGEGFAPPMVTNWQSSPANAGTPLYAGAGDFNGDGKLDVAITSTPSPFNAPTGITIALGNGDGTFQSSATYGAGMAGPIAIGDFNNDGKLDVIGVNTRTTPPEISVILGNGDGTFGFPVNTSAADTVLNFAIGDFNRDGKLDLAALMQSPGNPRQLEIWFGNGDGTFSAGSTYNAGLFPLAIVAKDVNGDGILDLVIGNGVGFVVSNAIPSNVTVLLGNGNGTFQTPIITTAGNEISSIAIADFNLDGKQDVLIGNSGRNDVSLLLGNGDGTLQPPVQFYVGGSLSSDFFSFAVADFDGNGSPDVAAGGANVIALLLNTLGQGGPAALLSTNVLSFGSEPTGQTSATQAVTLSYSGSSALSIGGVTISGVQSGDFKQTNSCGTILNPGAMCTIDITFTPQATGLRAAMVQITDKASNSPQIINLSGTGTAIGLTIVSGGSNSATVSAGHTANYTLAIGGQGMSGTATLSCSGAPSQAVCTLPANETLSAGTVVTFTVSVSTMVPTMAAVHHLKLRTETWLWATILLPAFAVTGRLGLSRRKKPLVLYLPLLILLVLFVPSCGGGSGSTHTHGGTPPGTYTLTITATSGSSSQTVPLTLIVE